MNAKPAFTLRIINDGKANPTSWEAWFASDASGLFIEAWGYGATEDEARLQLASRLAYAAQICNADVVNKP